MNNLNNIPGEIIKTSQLPEDMPTHLVGVILGTSPKTVKYSTTLFASQIASQMTDVVRTSFVYSDPTWLGTLHWNKIINTPSTILGYGITDAVSSSRTLSINGTTYDLSANRSWTVGDVLSSGSYVNPSWITSLAWTKITGAPSFITGITSSDVVTALGYTPVTNARTITINGTTYDLTANRTWSVGDLLSSGSYANPSWITSLAWSKITGAPSFLTSAITSLNGLTGTTQTFVNDTNVTMVSTGTTHTLTWSGTLADSRIASSTNWNTAYTNRITSLTTTGSSGAATLVSNVLNIPTYTLSGLGGQPLNANLTSISALTFASTSFVKMTAAGTFALDTNTYLTAESDTLASVTGRGNTTTNAITVGGITSSGNILNSAGFTYSIGNLTNPFAIVATTSIQSPANLSFLANSRQAILIYQSTRNVVIQDGGTFTDAGFRLDVNGTARIQNQLTTTGSITAASAIARGMYMNQTLVASANNDSLNALEISPTFTVGAFTGVSTRTLKLNYASGGFHEFFEDANYIYARSYGKPFAFGQAGAAYSIVAVAANSFFPTVATNQTDLGTSSLGWRNLYVVGTSNLGQLTTTGSITAASAIARGVYMNQTLVASANNDVLVGLDINPTFTNGSFTGVRNYALRIGSSTKNLNYTIGAAGVNSTLEFNFDAAASIAFKESGTSVGSFLATSSTFVYGTYRSSQLNLIGLAGGLGLRIANTSRISFYSGNADPDLSTEKVAIFGATGNVVIQNGGTFTDAGFRLDVVGADSRFNGIRAGLGAGQVATNTVFGNGALNANTTGLNNTVFGYNAGSLITTGGYNTLIGNGASSPSGGFSNTLIGSNAVSQGSSNTIIGVDTNSGAFSSSVILGRAATATANNQFVVGSASYNAGAVAAETNTTISSWAVKINGTDRKLLLLDTAQNVIDVKQSVAASTSTTTINWVSGNVSDTTLTSNTTFTLSNPVIGTYIIKLTQGGAGGFLATWPVTIKWSGGIAPVLTTTAGKIDIITLVWDGTAYFGSYALNF